MKKLMYFLMANLYGLITNKVLKMDNITYHYTEDHDITKMTRLMKRHKFYDKSLRGSHFLGLIQAETLEYVHHMGTPNPNIKITSFSTVIAKNEYKKPVGILIFEKYLIDDKVNTSFLHSNKKYNYKMTGCIGIFVLEEYRNKGIANEMARIFNQEYVKNSDFIELICAKEKAEKIVNNFVDKLHVTKSPHNQSVWMDTAKSSLNFSRRRIV